MSKLPLKENYQLAGCCAPVPEDDIVGYFSHDGFLKVHRADCTNLCKNDPERLVELRWSDILAPEPFRPEEDYSELDPIDFRIMKHHERKGIDYSLKVAKDCGIDKQTAFDRHRRLRDMALLERVEPTMVQYRKGLVRHKWIKHRNHTYYDLTDKGHAYLAYFEENKATS